MIYLGPGFNGPPPGRRGGYEYEKVPLPKGLSDVPRYLRELLGVEDRPSYTVHNALHFGFRRRNTYYRLADNGAHNQRNAAHNQRTRHSAVVGNTV